MTVKCFVSLAGEGRSEIYKFVTLPRVGEEIILPGHIGEFIVESIAHFARETGKNITRPTVQIHLCASTQKKVHHRSIGFVEHKGDFS
jgi:hypothetical protein